MHRPAAAAPLHRHSRRAGPFALRRRGRNQLALAVGLVALAGAGLLLVAGAHSAASSLLQPGDGRRELLAAAAPKHFSALAKFLVLFYILGVLYCLLGFAIVCEDYFVASLIAIGNKFQLSDDVMGATLMAAGSSLPEVFSSLVALWDPTTDNTLGMATVCGSSVYNILIIIGWSAIAGRDVLLDWKPLVRDSAFYFITIFYLLGTFSDGKITIFESFVALVLYSLYVARVGFMTKNAQAFAYMDELAEKHSPYLAGKSAERAALKAAQGGGGGVGGPLGGGVGSRGAELLPVLEFDSLSKEEMGTGDVSMGLGGGGPPSYGASGIGRLPSPPPPPPQRQQSGELSNGGGYAQGGGGGGGGGGGAGEEHEAHPEVNLAFPRNGTPKDKALFCVKLPLVLAFSYTIPDCRQPRWAHWYWATFGASIVWIGLLASYMVNWASHVACVMGIPALVVGLTVLAAGTSLPDTLSSVIVARKGLGDMAVANAIGSNVFNVLFGLGFPWTLYMVTHPDKAPLAGPSGLMENSVTMLLCGVFYLAAFFGNKLHATVKLGYAFIGVYACYVLFVIIRFSGGDPDPTCE